MLRLWRPRPEPGAAICGSLAQAVSPRAAQSAGALADRGQLPRSSLAGKSACDWWSCDVVMYSPDRPSRSGVPVVPKRLIAALGAGRATILFGAGPSSAVGLPDWTEMVARIVDAASDTIGDVSSLRREIEGGDLPKALGDLQRMLDRRETDGRGFIVDALKVVLTDTGRQGVIYDLMTRLNVSVFMTTNYEAVFERHLRAHGHVPSVYTNTRESLEELDTGSYEQTILHLHGSLALGGQLILTDADYSRVIQAHDFEPLRKTIESFLISSPVVILGYSLSDPDLQLIAQNVCRVIRKKQPILAILCEADRKKVATFAEAFNIEVLTYRPDDHHAELARILSVVVKWLETPQVSTAPNRDDLRMAQALYVYDATRSAGIPGIVLALQSLILTILGETPEGLAPSLLPAALKSRVGANVDADMTDAAWRECEREGLVELAESTLTLTALGAKRVDVSKRKYENLWQNLAEHAQLEIQGEEDVRPALEDALLSLFSERAAEAVALSVLDCGVETSSLDLYELIARGARALKDGTVRLRFIEYVVDLLRKPNTTQKLVVEHLGRSLFCTHALKLDVNTNALLKTHTSGRALIIDSNVLIAVLAEGSPQHESMCGLLASAEESGLKLHTTRGFLREVLMHADWARSFVDANQGNDAALLAAAGGFGSWDGNDFLSGMIATDNELGHRQGLSRYLALCLGSARPDEEALCRRLTDRWRIGCLDVLGAADVCPDVGSVCAEIEAYIDEHAPQGKNRTRVRAEAEAYALVHQWTPFAEDEGLPAAVTVLSMGAYLNRVAREGPFPLDCSVTTTPSALNAYIATYFNAAAIHDFSTIVRSEFFSFASDLIEDQQLERYFSGTIAAADRAYREVLRPRIAQLEADIVSGDLPETLDEVPPIQRPGVVQGLATYINGVTDPAEVERLRREARESQERLEAAEKGRAEAEERLKRREKGARRYERQQKRHRKEP